MHIFAEEQPGLPIVQPQKPEPCIMVIFGASGDLTDRKLVPSLYNLHVEGLLPEEFALIGYARSLKSEEQFRTSLREALDEFSRKKPVTTDAWQWLSERIFISTGGYESEEDFTKLRKKCEEVEAKFPTKGNRLFYLSTPAQTFPGVIRCLRESGLSYEYSEDGPWSRVIIEKPFGHDLASAQELNRLVADQLDEKQTYRIDHFLGKETVQNILVMRFGNSIFEPLWNRKYISHVEITAAETIGIGSRGGFYEQTGVLRDMVQNHLLQVMALCAMEQPVHFGPDEIRDEKAKVFRAIRKVEDFQMNDNVVLGQYEGYHNEKNVDPNSKTPTYGALRFYLDNWRWQGVPFYLRTGKKLAGRTTEISVQFQTIPLCLFGADEVCQRVQPNVLTMRLGPKQGISLQMAAKVPGESLSVGTVTMDMDYEEAFKKQSGEAYERLLLDCMRGDPTLFARRDEVEEAWRVVTPIIEANEAGKLDVHSYEGGSSGPKAADTLLSQSGHRWVAIQ